MNRRAARSDFASDNTAGICPEAWAMLEAANVDAALSYGDDQWTARACDLIRDLFETDHREVAQECRDRFARRQVLEQRLHQHQRAGEDRRAIVHLGV